MKKKKKLPYFVITALYLTGMILGLIIMLAVPYFRRRQDLIQIAQDSASAYSREQDFGITAHFGLHYIACDLEGNRLDQYTSGYSDTVIHIDMQKYLNRLKDHGTGLYYDYLKLSMQSRSRNSISLVVVSPIKANGNLSGILFVVRELIDLPNNLIIFFTVWTFIFLLLLFFYHLLAKKDAALEQLQRTYIASMNHELKSPITSIKALSSTLLDGYVTDPQKQLFYYSTILKEANILEDTVQEILELSKLQSTKELFRKEAVTPENAFGTVLNRYEVLFSDIDVHFSAMDFQKSHCPELYTAPALISRVLELLLHNASKFVGEENGQVDVSFEEQKECIVVHVRDNGCGISPDELPLIFNRFYKSENPQNKSGCGLGLSIVKEILDGLEENIWVESKPGNGTVFSFTVSIR